MKLIEDMKKYVADLETKMTEAEGDERIVYENSHDVLTQAIETVEQLEGKDL